MLPPVIPTDDADYVRQASSGALLNTNTNDLKMYKARREKLKKDKALAERMNKVEEDVASLHSKIDDVTTLLRKILEQKVS